MSIAIYGDLIQDLYIYGTSERLSPEAPVPVVKYQSCETRMGGAGNVYKNLQSLTKNVTLCTTGENIPEKTRVFSDGHYVTRIDKEGNSTWNHHYTQSDFTIVSDYAKGAIEALDWSNLSGKIIVDPKGSLEKYRHSWCVKPNSNEFKYMDTKETLELSMKAARESLCIEHLIVTLGADGAAYYGPDGYHHIAGIPVEVSDVTGAGDTFTAVLVWSLDSGNTMLDSLRMANKAASIAVKHRGCYVIQKSDLQEPLVFTNGCFDILHPGHVHLINECKKMGRVVVGLNSDESVRRLKGDSRPINNQSARAKMLELLGVEVIIFDEDTPYNLVQRLQPAIVVKGGDYTPEQIKSKANAKVVIIDTLSGYSTTNIVNRIKDASNRNR